MLLLVNDTTQQHFQQILKANLHKNPNFKGKNKKLPTVIKWEIIRYS